MYFIVINITEMSSYLFQNIDSSEKDLTTDDQQFTVLHDGTGVKVFLDDEFKELLQWPEEPVSVLCLWISISEYYSRLR